jgi:putative NIF3 family GTP cyclohydrolase 1 type 2
VSVRLADVIDVLDGAYPPHLAADWDSVGLVCGDPDDDVASITIAVDATAEVVAEVPERGLLLAHHPLLLRGVDTVAASTAKGSLLHRLIRGGSALFTAHTNADAASPGVSDALAETLGLTVDGPLAPAREVGRLDTWVVYVPVADADALREALFEAGAGQIGDYSHCCWSVQGTGQFLPLTGASPTIGTLGSIERLAEERIGGAGDSLLDVVADADVQAYVTADLRHHPADEHRRASDVALVDVAHWASEYPWCGQAAALLRNRFGESVPVRVSSVRTDPWNIKDPRAIKREV